MKITILSLDLYGFNKKTAEKLISNNIETNYINSAEFKYKYKNFSEKILNFLSKTFIKKNLKKIKQTNFILDKISNDIQDITLVVDPAHFNHTVLKEVRKKSKKLIAYNYDSYAQLPIPNEFLNYFDEIYSFDKKDCANHNLKFITNFIYLPKHQISESNPIKSFTIQSFSKDRIKTLSNIADIFENNNFKNFEFYIYGKKRKLYNNRLIYFKNRIPLETIFTKMENSEILLDLVRNNQNGLSFRIFEALALQKKIITTNKSIVEYDFYNENNILVIDKNKPSIPSDFLKKTYEPIDENIYNNYTLENWIYKIFGIKIPQ